MFPGRVTHSAEMSLKSQMGAQAAGLMKIFVVAIGVLALVLVACVFASNIWIELTQKKRRWKRIEQSRSKNGNARQW